MKYTVTITQYHEYTVEADDENKAIIIGIEEFEKDMRKPIAQTWYDDVEVEEKE